MNYAVRVSLVLLTALLARTNATITLKVFQSKQVGPVPHPVTMVTVPPGWKVVGGGAKVEYSGDGQLLAKSYPTAGGRSWRVQSKDHLRSDPGYITAFAVAMHDPHDEWEVKIFSKLSTLAQHPNATATVEPGYTLVGGGGNVFYQEPGNVLVRSQPSGPSGWLVASKDHLQPAPSRLMAYAIGVRSRHGAKLETKVLSQDQGPSRENMAILRGPRGYGLTACGAGITRGGPGNMLVENYPLGKKLNFLSAFGKDHLVEDRQTLTVYGIFVKGALVETG